MVIITHFPVIIRLVGVMTAGVTAVGFSGIVYESLTTKRPGSLRGLLAALGIMGAMALVANLWVLFLVRRILDAEGTWHKHGLGGGAWLTLIAIAYLLGAGGILGAMLTSEV